MSSHVPYELFIFVLGFLFKKKSWINLKSGKLEPYAFNFAIGQYGKVRDLNFVAVVLTFDHEDISNLITFGS